MRVLSPLDAVDSLIGLLDQAIAGTVDATQLTALQNARKALAGSVDGFAANGAIDKLEKDLATAALEKLHQALDDMQAAQTAGAGVAPLVALLEDLIAVLGDM